MPNLPAMPIPQGLSGEPIPPGWFAGIWRVVDSLRRIEQTRTPGDGRGRRERTAALVHMTSATEGDVYLTSSEARETGAEIKSLDGGDLVDGAWYVALWLDIDGGSFWTAVAVYSPAEVCETQIDLAPQLRVHEDGGEYELQVRMKKVKLAKTVDSGVVTICPEAGDYGAWSGVGACPPIEEIDGGTET